ncbi:MAG: GNAT family N-acetyltransferase [Sphingomonas sp.]|nr:GNAT family N-acetyltransferase [Sphingomonas sp.]
MTAAPTRFRIIEDDATGPEITALIALHLADLASDSAAEYQFALGLEALRSPGITLWSAWDGAHLAGCAALKDLGDGEGEVKSMRTHPAHLRRGVAGLLLDHLIAQARARGWHRLNLETGTSPAFAPAHALYHRFGFVDCPAFADYTESPHNRFMTLALGAENAR